MARQRRSASRGWDVADGLEESSVVEPASISSPKHLTAFLRNPDRAFHSVLNFILPTALLPAGGRIKALRDTDVRQLQSRVPSPTMVLHRRNDRAVRIDAGRDMARQIPGASIRGTGRQRSLVLCSEQRPILNAIERFIRGLPRDRRHRR